jgi:hypothetical protein
VKRSDSNPLRRELAQSLPAGSHLEADVLSAFAEGALLPREREEALAHLSVCARCRQVLSVASNAAPEPVVDVQAKPLARPARHLIGRWLPWLVAAAGVLVIGSVLLIHDQGSREIGRIQAPQVEQKQIAQAPPPTSQVVPPQTVTPAKRESTLTARSEAMPAPAAGPTTTTAAKAPSAPAAAIQHYSAQDATSQSEIAGEPGAAVDSAAQRQRTQRLSAENEAAASTQVRQRENLQTWQSQSGETQPSLAPKPSVAFSGAESSSMKKTAEFRSARPQWRINEFGQLERSSGNDDWQSVPMLGTSKLHVLAVSGSDLWAGGEHLRLEHSIDNGATWASVPLPAKNGRDHMIAHIHFASSQEGTVDASDGTSWHTTDGGTTWK